ncbi:DUF551 domain-containing protein [Salmonella enterica]|uniref:DUF551 domain-containing protein n=1 Tax=Salmonella enterica TaxID=28901 RepID=A0A5V4Z854_SALER|nr:DUF551 domain-containing protein [Salmonella enterica]ECI4613717.1 DUF551 domain-containing protein [Salmonella enterica subsp. diarizonae]ECJ5902553.1 DUF551 domain-containing protein [Salmonella enterica subsp. diarizonae]EDQ0072890.1 DUF551 domain-containing protein [Salmonella enterica subsp. diarizonae]EDV7622342.1 DUF551 domain-containing protein [Salmonella enterica subsp. diarizonae]
MTTITKEWLQQTIAEFENTRDDIPFGLSDDDAKILKVLKQALASFEAEPVGEFYHEKQDGWYQISEGDKVPDNRRIPLYTAPPVQETGVYKDMLNIIGLLENNEWAEHCTSTVLGSLLESEITRLVGKEQPAPVVPVGLRMALSNAGIAAPESDEMLAATHEKYIQALVTWVKDRKPFQPAPIVPEEITADGIIGMHECGFVEGWNACRAAMLQGSQPVSNHDELPYAQVKAVADLYALCWQSGEVVTYTPDPEKATIWLNNYSGTCVQEYVKLERLQEALAGNSPVTPDGWISCSERMPAQDDWVLIYSKYGEYLAGQVQGKYVELNDGTLSWLGAALHWMPLPAALQQE